MNKKYLIIYILLLTVFTAVSLFVVINKISADNSGAITITVNIPVCGDNEKENGEECDNNDLGGATCSSRGFLSGTLTCDPACDYDTSGCSLNPSCGDGLCNGLESCSSCPSDCGSCGGGGGGGGGGGAGVIPTVTNVIFSGRAYPKSSVTLLKDAQVAATTIAGADANFEISLSGLAGGNYVFSIYAEDSKGVRSSLLTFSVSITTGATNKISGIFLAPTIAIDKAQVKRGENIAIFGESVPNSDITISVSSDEEFFNKTKSDASGVYLYNFDTAVLENGEHSTKSKAALNNEISSFSKAVSFVVGTETILEQPKCSKADLNCDGKVNLVDFSIAAYWYKKDLSQDFKKIEAERLNADAKINLVDFSIMAFYWTG
jgi:hypothetical protein